MVPALAVVLAALASPELDEARRLLKGMQYASALPKLEAAQQVERAELAELCEAYALAGLVHASLKRPGPATESLKRTLVLCPDYQFPTNKAPRVMTSIYAARAWVKENGSLDVALSPTWSGEQLTLSVAVTDPLSMAAKLELEVVEDGKARALVLPLPLSEHVVARGKLVELTLTIRNARKQVILQRGRPAKIRYEAPVVLAPTAPTPVASAPVVTAAPPPPGVMSPTRWAAVTMGGLALVGVTTGVIFGVQSSQGRAQFEAALAATQSGGLSPLTYPEATALNQAVTTNAWIANVSFISAGVLAVTGLVLWLVGAP